jgi:hypothetical protein
MEADIIPKETGKQWITELKSISRMLQSLAGSLERSQQ